MKSFRIYLKQLFDNYIKDNQCLMEVMKVTDKLMQESQALILEIAKCNTE